MITSEFYKSVYDMVKRIPKGQVSTYGQLALLLGVPNLSRLVGRAMSKTPPDPLIPSHRVVNCKGRLVPGWEREQSLLLKEDGVSLKPNGCVDLKIYLWR